MSVRIGFLGSGFMGQLAHLHSFSRVPDCDIVALAEVRDDLRRRVAEMFQIPRTYATHDELLEDASVDAVVMAQPYHRNIILGAQILRAGKHLLTEKPMAARLDDAREMVDLAEKGNIVYAVGFMKRYDPGMMLARSLLGDFDRSGEMGALRMVDTTCFLGDWLQNPGSPIVTDEAAPSSESNQSYPHHVSAEQRAVYDHFLNIYSHNINLLHFLLPDRRLGCVSARRNNLSFLVTLQADDILVSLRGCPSKSYRWEETTTFIFEQGRLHIQSPTPLNRQQVAQVTVVREVDGIWREENCHPPVEWAFLRQAEAFVEAVAEGQGRDLPTRGAACLADVALMQDVFRKLQ